MQFLGSLNGAAKVEMDALTKRFTRKDLKVDVEGSSGLTAGIHVRPADTVRLGFSYRQELALDYHLVTDITIKDAGQLIADIYGTSLYTPAQYTWGAAYDPVDSVTVTADVVWARWSEAPDPTAHFDVTLDGKPLDKGMLQVDSPKLDLGAVDTLSPRLGVEWRPTPDWAVRSGYALMPTPLPAQTSASNYIDSEAHQVAIGGGYSFPDPMEIHDSPMTVDIAGQLTMLSDRRMEKIDTEDEVGSYTAGGHVWNVALTVRHDFN